MCWLPGRIQHLFSFAGLGVDLTKPVYISKRRRVQNRHMAVMPIGNGAGPFTKRHIIIQKFKIDCFVANPHPGKE